MPNARAAVAVAAYRRRRPEPEPLYQMLAEHLETFLGLPVGLGRYKPPKFASSGNPMPPIDESRSVATASPAQTCLPSTPSGMFRAPLDRSSDNPVYPSYTLYELTWAFQIAVTPP